MQELRMTKELAEKILELTLVGQRNDNDKFRLRKDLNCLSWDEVQTKAMLFLLGEKGVAV